jgi:hypothetical protein
VKGLFQLFDRDIHEGLRHRAADVVHDDVEAAKSRPRSIAEGADLYDIAEVGDYQVRSSADRFD